MEDLITLLLLAMYVAFIALDLALPARTFPKVTYWRAKGLLFFVLYVALSSTLPFLWDDWLGAHRLVDAQGLGTWAGAALGFSVTTLISYAYHRTVHRVPFLFRWLHQMHHSAERIDVFGAFYLSPLDMIGFMMMGSLGLVWAVGLTPEAGLVANALLTFCAVFQHTNLRTPRWLGLFVQRPEAHSLHHQRGVHAFNYSDFPLWDMLFGTYRNPATWSARAGYYDGASRRVVEMLLGRDVSTPVEVSGSDPTLVGAPRSA